MMEENTSAEAEEEAAVPWTDDALHVLEAAAAFVREQQRRGELVSTEAVPEAIAPVLYLIRQRDRLKRRPYTMPSRSVAPAAACGIEPDFYSTKPTETVVVVEPQLVAGTIVDAVVLKDRIREIPVLGFLVEGILQPISQIGFLLLGLLTPLWGAFSIIELTGGAVQGGWALNTMAVNASFSSCFLLIQLLDINLRTAALLCSEAWFSLFANIATRIIYTAAAISYFAHPANVLHVVMWLLIVTFMCFYDAFNVTHMCRYSRLAYASVHGKSRLRLMSIWVWAFAYFFEIARHFATLHALSEAAREIDLVPTSFGAGKFRLTNLHVMNASFSTSMVLYLRILYLYRKTGGKLFMLMSADLKVSPQYSYNSVPTQTSRYSVAMAAKIFAATNTTTLSQKSETDAESD